MRTCTTCLTTTTTMVLMLIDSGATPVQWGGAPMSPFDTLNNFPSPGPNPNPNPYAERSGSPDPWGIGGGPWQDLSANQWPRSPPPNQDGFHSTAWPGGNGASPSMTGQPIGDGFFGSRAGTTSPYSNTTSPRPYTHNLDNNAFASYNYSGGPASAPLPSPPLHEKPRRSFSIGRRKARDDGWYPRDTNNYGEANLAQRPRDWSQDFELHPSMLKRVAAPKNRSDVKGDDLSRSFNNVLIRSRIARSHQACPPPVASIFPHASSHKSRYSIQPPARH